MTEPDRPARPTLAKIIATLGPATDDEQVLRRLVLAGASIFRLNFSHGSFEAHEKRLALVRRVGEDLGIPIAAMGDLRGPKIRVGRAPDGGVELGAGEDVVILSTEEGEARLVDGTAHLPCTYEPIGREVQPGERVLINDGAIRMLAVEREAGDPDGSCRCRVVVGGLVTSAKGINLPDTKISAPALSDWDWECVEWAVAHGVDFLAMSFVRRAAEVRELRNRLAGMCSVSSAIAGAGEGALIPIVTKIEKPEALDELDGIIEAADGVMVARGDLGVEMDLAQVPVVQKRLIAKAHEWGKPVIVATQMLETMMDRASPTRAEASDVANAIFDGADVVMLSGETAVGKHPVLAVETMRRIIGATEERLEELRGSDHPGERLVDYGYRTAALAHGAAHVAQDIGASIVACWSQKGGTARYLSKNKLSAPIVAYSSDARQTRRMALLRGVTAIHCAPPASGALSDWNAKVEADLLERRWVREGEPIVLLAGKPLGSAGATTTLAVHYIGDPSTGYMRHTSEECES